MSASRLFTSIFGAAVLAALQAAPVLAMPFEKFDAMSNFGQAEFIAEIVDTTETALTAEGKADWAAKIDDLFTTILPGDRMSLGLIELDSNVARARVYDLERVQKDPASRRLNVEDALFVTLKKNGMELSRESRIAIVDKLANFHPMTYGEFIAKQESEQRRIVRRFAAIAHPDFEFLDEVDKRMKGEAVDKEKDDEMHEGVAIAMKELFPVKSGDQPGFRGFVSVIEAEAKKDPNDPGVLFSLVIYLLDAVDRKLLASMTEMDANTVKLPDGRSVFVDKNGDYWTWPVGATEGDAQKLEGADRDLAIKLAQCKARRGIKLGADALVACRDEVGLAPTQGRAWPSQPPPSPAPSSPTTDTTSGGFGDLIGEGGFIKPAQQ